MMPSHRTSTALLTRRAVLGIPILALAACGDDAAAPVPTAPALSAQEILTAASARLAALPTLRFTLEIEGQTYIDSSRTIELLSATGSLARPESVDTEFKVKVLRGLTFTIRMIILDAERWTTDIVTGAWGPAPIEFDYDAGVFFDTADGIGPILGAVTAPSRGADERIFDRDCYRVDAIVEQSIIGPLTGYTLEGSPIIVQLWVERESSDVLRIILKEPPTVEGRTPASWTLELSGQGEPVTIDRPVVDGG